MERKNQSDKTNLNNNSSLIVSNIESCSVPCSSSSQNRYGSYRELDTESLISKKTTTTSDNQDSDTENDDKNVNDTISSDFEDLEDTNNQEIDENSNDSDTASESINSMNPQVTLVSEYESTSQNPYTRLSQSFRSYLNASNSYQVQTNPDSSEALLPIFGSEISLTENLKIRPTFDAKSPSFYKLLDETNDFFYWNDSYDLSSIYKLKNLFINYENYYSTMLIPLFDNFKLDSKIDPNFCCKRMKHSSSGEIKYESGFDEDEYQHLAVDYLDHDSDDGNGDQNQSVIAQDEFHLCSICCHCLHEPITLVCGCSFCKSCLNEYNAALERAKAMSQSDSELKSNKRKLNNESKNTIELYKCYNCSFVHENNSTQFLKTNITLSKLVDKFWSKNVDSRKLRNDLRKYVCFIIDNNLENFKLKVMERLFLKAYELDPSNHLILADLFLLNYFDNCNPNCLKYAQSASELKPNWPFAFFMKSIYYLSTGNLAAVKENLSLCLKLDSKLVNLKHKLKQVLFKSDMSESNDSGFANSQSCSSDNFSLNSANEPISSDNQQKSMLNNDTSKYVIVNSHLVSPSELECSVCCRLLYKPVTTPCGHTFCCSCLERSLDHQDKCPLCKDSLADYLAERRSNVTQFLDKLIQNFYFTEYKERQKQYHDDIKELIGDENQIPVFVCTLALPNIPCPLHIFEPRYRLMLRRAIETGSNQFGMCMFTEKTAYQYTEYGCMLEIKTSQFTRDGRAVVSTCGGRRFKVLSSGIKDGYNVAKVEWVKDVIPSSEDEINELNQIHGEVYKMAKTWFSLLPQIQKNRINEILNISELPVPEMDINTENGPAWHWILLNILPIDNNFQYKFLTKTSLKERLLMLKKLLWYLLAPSRHPRSNSMNSSSNPVTQNPQSSSENTNDLAANSDNNSNFGTENSESSSNSLSDFSNNNNQIAQRL